MVVRGSRKASVAIAVVAAIAGHAPTAKAARVSPPRAVTPSGFYVEAVSLAATPSGSRPALLVDGHRLHPISSRLVARLGRGATLGATRRLDGGATSIGGARASRSAPTARSSPRGRRRSRATGTSSSASWP